jgi:hypothetical protein
VALSDAGAHLSFLCDPGFGLHLLGHWARERKDLTLEQAVRAVTSAVARAYRITDRGALAPGMWADLMLFDPKTVGRGAKRRAICPPAPAASTPRPSAHGVWVNGVRIVDERGGSRARLRMPRPPPCAISPRDPLTAASAWLAANPLRRAEARGFVAGGRETGHPLDVRHGAAAVITVPSVMSSSFLGFDFDHDVRQRFADDFRMLSSPRRLGT